MRVDIIFFLDERQKKNSRKMRLYDQGSSTPMKLDGKKWMRPNNFLPSRRETAVAKPSNTSNGRHSALTGMVENANCGSETSASTAIEISKVYKHHTIYDDFRFDIDEDQELSIQSSSTLSTHSTLRQVTQDPYGEYRKEFPNPISVAKHESSESSSRYSRTSVIAMTTEESLSTESGDLDDEFLTPRLTLTQSSEEDDSMWIEFPGFLSKNPFRAALNTHQSNKQKPIWLASSMDRQSLGIKCAPRSNNKVHRTSNFDTNKRMVSKRYIMDEGTRNYRKYHEMLLYGICVDEVSEAMEKDEVDPSIISLVLAASKISQYP